MKFKVTMTVTKTYDVNPKAYGDPPLTDPKEMLAIDVSAYEDTPEILVVDETAEVTVIGEVVEE